MKVKDDQSNIEDKKAKTTKGIESFGLFDKSKCSDLFD